MKKSALLAAVCLFLSFFVFGQDEENEEVEKRSFKENLFTGGSVSLAYYNNTFLIGANPVFGYSPTNFIDLGIVVNYTYTAYRYDGPYDDKLHQTVYGAGGFLRLYPVRFLFAQAQIEQNYIRQKYIPEVGNSQVTTTEVGSVLVGGGYTTGRMGRGGKPFFYLSVMFDVTGDINSPYTDSYGRTIPIFRGGLQVPLFQKKSEE